MRHDSSASWREQVYKRIATAVRTARRERSAQDIADETARLGYPITRAQISNFETGRRQSIDVTDLMILAAALGVPPITLIFGGDPDAEIALLPDHVGSTLTGLAWFTGTAALAAPRPDADPKVILAADKLPMVDEGSPEAHLLDLVRFRAEKRRQLTGLVSLAELLKRPDDAEQVAKLLPELNQIDSQIKATVDEMERAAKR